MSDSSDSGLTKRSTKTKGKPCSPIKRVMTAKARRPVQTKIKFATRQERPLDQTQSEEVLITETAHTQAEPPLENLVEGSTDGSDCEASDRQESERIHFTSTPEIAPPAKPRSDSSLLRIKAQLRAAAAITLEDSVKQVAEPEDADKSNESAISDSSAVGGGALHEIPRLAGTLLQQSKAKLEESRTLNREVRESLCSGLHGLYEMIVRLADSRNRHIAEKEKSKSYYEHLLGRLEARHANTLKDLQYKQLEREAEIAANIKKTFKEAEAARFLVYDVEARLKDHSTWEQKVESELKKSSISTDVIIGIQKDIAKLRDELGSISGPILARAQPNAQLQVSTRREGHGTAQAVDTRPSFAQVVCKPQHGMVLESVDPRQTSGDILKEVQSKVDVINLGIKINKVSKLSKQRVMINCDTEEDRQALTQAIETSNR